MLFSVILHPIDQNVPVSLLIEEQFSQACIVQASQLLSQFVYVDPFCFVFFSLDI